MNRLKIFIVISYFSLFAAEHNLPSFTEWINLAQKAKAHPQKITLELETQDGNIIKLSISDPLLRNFPLLEDLGLKVNEKAGLGFMMQSRIQVPFTSEEIEDLRLISQNDLLKSFTKHAIFHANEYSAKHLNRLMQGIYYFGLPLFTELDNHYKYMIPIYLNFGVSKEKITYDDIQQFMQKTNDRIQTHKLLLALRILYLANTFELYKHPIKLSNDNAIKFDNGVIVLAKNIIEFLIGTSFAEAQELSIENKLSNIENKLVKYCLKKIKDAKANLNYLETAFMKNIHNLLHKAANINW